MMLKPFQFDQDAARAAVLYIASELPLPDLHRVFKLMYFADKLHLERYGRLIAGESYLAFEFGPVPSEVWDMVKDTRDRPGMVASDETFVIEYKAIPGKRKPVPTIRPLQRPDLDSLSGSDLECLDETIRAYGEKSFDDLTRLSHDAAWKKADAMGFMALEDIIGTLNGAESLLAHLENPHP